MIEDWWGLILYPAGVGMRRSLHGSSHIVFPYLCPRLQSRGQRTLTPTLWMPHSGDSSPRPPPCLPKAPLKLWERAPGLQNWKHRRQDMEGKGGAISKSFLSFVGGCDNPCLALFISGLSHDLLSCLSHFNLESRQAPQLTSLPPCNCTRGRGLQA